MKRSTKSIIVSAVAIPIALTSAASAAAMEPLFGSNGHNAEKPKMESRYRGVKHGIKMGEELKEAIERGDYGAFQEIVKGLPEDAPMQNFSETDFNKLQEMHVLFVAGKHDEAKVIAEELGVHKNHAKHMRHDMGQSKHMFRKELKTLDSAAREAARSAMEAGDYNAFRAAIGEELMPEMTEEKFELRKQMHEAHKSGNRDEVKRIRSMMKGMK